MIPQPELLEDLTAEVGLDGVRAALGGPAAIPADMQPRLEALSAQVLAAAEPRACLLELEITGRGSGRVEVGAAALTGLGVASLLTACERLAAFSVTLGPGPGLLMQAASDEGRLVDLTLLDAIASEAVEALADQLQTEVERRCRLEQRASTRRYSPGYCDWALQEQAVLDGWGLFEKAGIKLTADCLMLPEKSVSAIIGEGPAGMTDARLGKPPACKRCPMRSDCPGP